MKGLHGTPNKKRESKRLWGVVRHNMSRFSRTLRCVRDCLCTLSFHMDIVENADENRSRCHT